MTAFLFGAAAMFAAMYSTQAILPELGDAFDVSPAEAGLTITILIGTIAFGAWFWGPLSDRIGRRRTLLTASALLVVPTALVPFAPSFELLLAGRGLQGLCMPGLLTVGVPYVFEAFGGRGGARVMGYYVSSLVAGGLVGRVGVALLAAVAGWRVGLGLVAVLAAAALLAMRRWLPPETHPPRRRAARRAAALASLRGNRQLAAATAAGSTLFFAFVGTFSFIDFRLEAPPFSYSPAVASLVFLFWALGVLGPVFGGLAERLGWWRLSLGASVCVMGGLALTLSPRLAPLAVGLACATAGMFAGATAAQVGVASATRADRGTASAVYFSVYYVAGGLGGYLPGLAWEAWRWEGVVLVGLGTIGVGLACLVGLARAR
jgi:YNFM family putative membrane transporter